MKLFLLSLVLLIFSVTAVSAQNFVTGKLLDSKTQEPLIGATVAVKGTTTAASASLTGSFKLKVPDGSNTLVFSYIGYVSKEIVVVGGKALGDVMLDANSGALKEVVINAPVIDRKTPIAVSTVNAEYIEEKGAGQEFPEVLKETPGVMATRTGGGFGDARISIRGFSSNNVALLINGIPANDVESGTIYWSDWAGLADVTSQIQAQRGLGASKVAAPSLGGTIAITTRNADAVAGGSLLGSVGSYGDNKIGVSVSSGLSDKGWATSFLLARRAGDGNADGLYYTGYSYYFNLTKKLSNSQSLSFNILGASQIHGQRYTYNKISTYKASPEGIRYSSDWGYWNGQVQSGEINYYNKPLAALNHSWTINESTELATVAYASYGSGAARYVTSGSGSQYTSLFPNSPGAYPRTGDAYSPLDFNALEKNNLTSTDGSALNYFRNQANDHQQYGVISSLKKKVGEYIDVLAGADLRYYEGQHYYQIQDLMGGQYVYDARSSTTNVGTGDLNNPYHRAVVGDRFNNNYQFNIASEGLFLQAEYSRNNKLSAFASIAASNTGNKRIDYFNYLNSDPNRMTKYVNFLGYQVKGGSNYNLDSHNNVFFNIGYMQRPPLVSSVFLNKNNTINANAVPEKLFSYEFGYGFRSADFTANLNLYRSTYKDRSVAPKQVTNPGTPEVLTINLTGLNELHQGIEFDMRYRQSKDLSFRGMFSLGKWTYLTNAGPVFVTSDIPNSTFTGSSNTLYIQGLNVGDAAQTTASFGFDLNVTPKLKVGSTYNYYGNYTAYFSPSNVTSSTVEYVPFKLPNYSLFDLNAVFKFKFAGLEASFIGNVNNLFNTTYLSDAYDQNGTAFQPAQNTAGTIGVYYGIGRTYTTTLKIKF
ncbi:TonB-dependent receptor [Mucilaginibacter sp. HMF5004]|uniref:TonB-dependent receptor n=1 Tax=Mucilaginibacter rivuli TaxID=2857527 RepID=UPI001C5E705B|nr:TonB-dependent receptor [Mucilaginibacter rivuli]MBW4890629.1 TonB-dependent receptor [Mucilaginibacter rivuli]